MSEWQGRYEDWRIDWATYGGPYIRYPAYPHPENGHDIARLSFADPTPFEDKRKRAALIAAAPDLLEALEALIDLHGKPMREEYMDGGPSFDLALKVVAAAHAAIRKAKAQI